MKKILASVLAFAMILSVCLMAGCGDVTETTTATKKPPETTTTAGNGAVETTTGATPTETTTESNPVEGGEETTTESTPVEGGDDPVEWDGYTKLPGYEDVTFRGATFTVACYGDSFYDPDYHNYRDVYSDRTDAISVACNEKTRLVEQLYDCTIEPVQAENPGSLMSAAATGGKAIHFVSLMGDVMKTYGSSRYNLRSLDLDLTQPWFNQSFVNAHTIKKTSGMDSLYAVTGDFALSSFFCTSALMFNQDLYDTSIAKDFGSIYDLVKEKKWTMDVFAQMVSAAKYDADGNSNYAIAEGDTLGWISYNATEALYLGSGMPFFSNNNGVLEFTAFTQADQWNSLINKCIEVYGTTGHEEVSYTDAMNAFAEGRALFYSELIYKIENDVIKNAENLKVSIVPYPLYTEAQDDYSTFVMSRCVTWAIPASVSNIDEVADFFTVYAAHSTAIVRPAWLDTYSYDYLSGAESREMLELVMNARTFDPGYTLINCLGEINGMVTSGNNMFTMIVNRRYNTWTGDDGVAGLVKKADEAAT